MKIRKLTALTLVVVMVMTLLSACAGQGASNTPAASGQETLPQQTAGNTDDVKTIRIGVVYPLTGTSAQAGQEYVGALKAAADIINNVYDMDFPWAATTGIQSLGGAKIEIVEADSQGSPEVGATETERLITKENCVIVMGCDASGVTKTSSAAAEKLGVPFVNGDSSSPSLETRGLEYFFKVGPSDATFVRGTFDYMDSVREKVGIEKIAIVGDEAEYGALYRELCEAEANARGYEIAASFTYASNPTSVNAECLKLKASGADVLLIASYTSEAILFTQTLKSMDINFKGIITARGGFIATEFFKTVGDDANYIFTENAWSMDSVADKSFIAPMNEAVKKFAGCDMNGNYARAMQALYVICDALERAGSTDPDALTKALRETDMDSQYLLTTWKGIKFDENQANMHADGIMTQVQNGTYMTVYPEVTPAVIPVPAWSER